MRFSSIIAIYALFWSISFFVVLPFRLKRKGVVDVHVPGQADGAPPAFSFARTCLWTTIVAAVLFALYYANYVNGWIDPAIFDLHGGQPAR
ncbi:DUF1467 family protein [Sphingomonas naphthae]|uniref:DUF1467 family protein n=1 Tax=Sphingomonas naphthae TaxID=1813468 RepID=A0ABY7TQQ7_9SPHN|nr:DUF1467 family protein [Sphingomonas naphthae]WCT74967.1 DUF1467 family protein [Sphingomonas naphthae]